MARPLATKKRSAPAGRALAGKAPARTPVTTRRPYLLYAVVTLAALLLAAAGIAFASAQNNRPLPGEAVPIQGQDHIEVGTTHPPYNSDPPTSGPHYVEAQDAGYYEAPLVDERVVHSLEHGYVVMSYDCSKLDDCARVQTELRNVVGRYSNWKVIAAPRQNVDAPLALTAWGRIEKLDSYDAARVAAFVDAWRNKGPERTMN